MFVRADVGENSPKLFPLDRTRDALSTYVAQRWPSGRRKAVMNEWSLSDEEARSVCCGKASWSTWDKIVNHRNGGWAVLFPVLGALLGQSAFQFLEQEKRRHAEHARALGALVADFGADQPIRPRRNSGSDREQLGGSADRDGRLVRQSRSRAVG